MANSKSVRSDSAKYRQSPRVLVTAQDEIAIMLDDKSYPVVNLSSEGLNIANTDHSPFVIGELVHNCRLTLSDRDLKNLTARIIHCSCGSDGKWNNGLKLIDLTDEESNQIEATISNIKNRQEEG